jgi:hypothetical protein
MPAKAGIHDFFCYGESKSWISAFAGMTGRARCRWVNLFGIGIGIISFRRR